MSAVASALVPASPRVQSGTRFLEALAHRVALLPLTPPENRQHSCHKTPHQSCVGCAEPWFVRGSHFFGTTPVPEPQTAEELDDYEQLGGTYGVWGRAEELLRNILLIAQSGWGKTTIMYRALCWVLFRTNTPMVIFDGSGNGTLSKNLLLWWHAVLDHAQTQGADPGDLRMRLLYMKVEERNRCGVSFDLFHPSIVRTTDGRDEPMGIKEIVTSLMGALAYMEEENEKFKLVRRYGEAGFAVLLAAGKKAKDLDQLYSIDSAAFRLDLRAEIERRHNIDLSVRDVDDEDLLDPPRTTEQIEERDYIRTQWHIVEDLFRQVKNSAIQLDHLTGSTRRHFQWATVTFKWFFNRPIVRLDRFFTKGGVLLVHMASGDRDANAMARAAIYAACRAAMKSKDRTQASLFVIDEQEGWRMGLLADDVAANARNSAMYHWFSLHDVEQVGSSFKTLWNLCQRKIIGAVADEELARFVLQYSTLLRPDGLVIPVERETVSEFADSVSERSQAREQVVTDIHRQSHEEGGMDEYTEERVNTGLYNWNPHRADPAKYAELRRTIRTLEAEHESLRLAVCKGQSHLKAALDALGERLRDLRGTARLRREAANWGDQADTKTRVLRERPERETELDVDETKNEDTSQSRKAERSGTQRVRVASTERIPIGEQIPFFTRAIVNPPVGRGLHIAAGEDAIFVDHAFGPLPLDDPDAGWRFEELVCKQRQFLEASWQRRRPAPQRAPGALESAPAPAAQPSGTPARQPAGRGPAPGWAAPQAGTR